MKMKPIKTSLCGIGLLAVLSGACIIPMALTPSVYAQEAGNNGNNNDDASSQTEAEEVEITGRDTDVAISAVNAPNAKYSTGTNISFKAKAKSGYITAIYPVVSEGFPFETNDEAYKTIEGNNTTQELLANYNFVVRSDVESGYVPVQFVVNYVKNGTEYTILKTVNVAFEGAPAATEATEVVEEKGNISTPRVIVTGYSIDKDQLVAGDTFKLTLHLQNTAKRNISNMKVTLGTEKGEFLPLSGSATQFVQSLGAGEKIDLDIEMSALANLEPRPYVLSVTCNYEDGEANPFESTENISIPVNQNTRIKITEFSISPDVISVGSESNVSFTINNLGKAQLSNVQVQLKGKTIDCGEGSFVGNIAAGASGFADLMVTGVEPTGDGDSKVQLIITYEDAMGMEQTFEDTVDVYVSEETYSEEPMDPAMYEEEPVAMPLPVKIIIGVSIFLLVAVAATVVIVIVLKKKKKANLEEDLDDLDEDLLAEEATDKE